MGYIAITNMAGASPAPEEPAVFDTVEEAWDYLAGERRRAEDEAEEVAEGYSGTVNILDSLAASLDWSTCENAGVNPLDGTGTVYGPTPGYDGDHDLGWAYTVTEAEDCDECGGAHGAHTVACSLHPDTTSSPEEE